MEAEYDHVVLLDSYCQAGLVEGQPHITLFGLRIGIDVSKTY